MTSTVAALASLDTIVIQQEEAACLARKTKLRDVALTLEADGLVAWQLCRRLMPLKSGGRA